MLLLVIFGMSTSLPLRVSRFTSIWYERRLFWVEPSDHAGELQHRLQREVAVGHHVLLGGAGSGHARPTACTRRC